MRGVKISVITPAYNMGEYIAECIESVLCQTLADIEMIVIDDGSTDDTAMVAKGYATSTGRVRYYFQKNAGSGAARNEGLAMAEGKYIAFLDPDDMFRDENVLQELYDAAEANEANMCGGNMAYLRNGAYSEDGGRKELKVKREGWIMKEDFPTQDGWFRFIYKRDFLEENNITFPLYRRNQDNPFFLTCLSMAGRVYCIKKTTYCYRVGHKMVAWDVEKVSGFAKGVRDELRICREQGLKSIYKKRCREIQGEFAALVYWFSLQSDEITSLIGEINTYLPDIAKLKENKDIQDFIQSSYEEIKVLLEVPNMKQRLLVFGAGVMGRRVLKYLQWNNIRVDAVIVSDTSNNPDVLEGTPVKEIDVYMPQSGECAVIAAVYQYVMDEVRELLKNKGFGFVHCIDEAKFYLIENFIEREPYGR